MPRTIFSALAVSLLLPWGAVAQGHQHGGRTQGVDTAQAAESTPPLMQRMQQMRGGQPGDSTQPMMQRMHEMQSHMQQMRGQPPDSAQRRMQGQQGRQGQQGVRGQQGMAAQPGQRAQTCIASGPRAGLSALLLGSVADLELTDEQRTQLQETLSRAREDALETLTPEQRERLESAPARPRVECPLAQWDTGDGGTP